MRHSHETGSRDGEKVMTSEGPGAGRAGESLEMVEDPWLAPSPFSPSSITTEPYHAHSCPGKRHISQPPLQLAVAT